METRNGSRFKATIAMTSDHTGIARELDRLEIELYRVLGRLDDPRYARDYIRMMISESASWLAAHPMLAARK